MKKAVTKLFESPRILFAMFANLSFFNMVCICKIYFHKKNCNHPESKFVSLLTNVKSINTVGSSPIRSKNCNSKANCPLPTFILSISFQLHQSVDLVSPRCTGWPEVSWPKYPAN